MSNHRILSTLAALKKNEAAVMAPVIASEAKARKKRNAYTSERLKTDKAFRIAQALRTRLSAALRAQKGKADRSNRTSATKRMLGCTVSEFMDHIAKYFSPGMSWDNHGEWEIDHVKPCCAFDLTKRSEQHKCFHYSNMEPIWKHENRAKSGKWAGAW